MRVFRGLLVVLAPVIAGLIVAPIAYTNGKHHAATTVHHATTKTPDAQSVTDFNDGFDDGRADATGDNDRDGRIEPGEAGWACRHTPLTDLDLCLSVANRPGGPADLASVHATPGTTAYRTALTTLTHH